MLKMTCDTVIAAGWRGVNLGLTTASGVAAGLIDHATRFETRNADACAENTPKSVTSVDNVMTQA